VDASLESEAIKRKNGVDNTPLASEQFEYQEMAY
jgi:hypothetical protein